MPVNFFTLVWPLAFTLIILAGSIVCIAALATLVAAITRARQLYGEAGSRTPSETVVDDRSSHPSQKSSNHAENLSNQDLSVLETFTTDGIHYTPVP